MSKLLLIGATLLAFTSVASAKDFAINCTVVSVDHVDGTNVGDEIGIDYNGDVADVASNSSYGRRNKYFRMKFEKVSAGMKWSGNFAAKYGIVDKSDTMVNVWTHLAKKNPLGGYTSTYVETSYKAGKQVSKLVSECKQYE